MMPGIETAMIDPLASSLADDLTARMMQHTVNKVWANAATASGISASSQPGPLEWAKFAMWLRGFLGALEGRELTTEDIDKIMNKLSTVDPESQNWRYGQTQPWTPRIPQSPALPQQPWTAPNTGNPDWTYRDSTTYPSTQFRAYYSVEDQTTTTDGTSPTTNTVQNDNAVQSP